MFKLKIRVVKAPDTDAIHKRLVNAVAAEFAAIGKDTERVLDKAVDNWDEKPTFYHTVDTLRTLWKFSQLHRAQTEGGKRYNWVRLGTKPHPITPRQASVLRFHVPNQPKTLAPGQSLPGGPGGIVFTMEVKEHPGIEPRNESENFPGDVLTRLFRNKGAANGFVQRTYRAGRKALRSR